MFRGEETRSKRGRIRRRWDQNFFVACLLVPLKKMSSTTTVYLVVYRDWEECDFGDCVFTTQEEAGRARDLLCDYYKNDYMIQEMDVCQRVQDSDFLRTLQHELEQRNREKK